MGRTEAMKEAQKRYRQKTGRTDAMKESQKRYMQKLQVTEEYKLKEVKRNRERWQRRRNYTQIDNMAVSFKRLYGY